MAKRRSPSGSGSIRKRTSGSWEARYTIGIDPETGKQIRRSVFGKSQKEVREKLRAVTASVDEGTYFEPEVITLAAWLNEWLETYTSDLKPLTLDAYQRQIRIHIIPRLGNIQLSSVTAPQIQRMYNDLRSGAGGTRALSAKTIKNLHGVLHKALKQAVNIGYVRTNPADSVVVPRVVRKEIKPLEGPDVAMFAQAVEDEEFRLVFLIDLYTGMRQGEILGLTWDCVNFRRRQIIVRQQIQQSKAIKGSPYYFAPLKNDRMRILTVAPTVMEYLRERKAEQSAQRLAAGRRWDRTSQVYTDSDCVELCCDSNLVFTNGLGRHLAINTVYKHFKRIVSKIGLSETRFHDLRHTFATASLENGDDVRTVQESLGHATASFTLDVYGHASDQMKENSAQRMEAYIKRHSG